MIFAFCIILFCFLQSNEVCWTFFSSTDTTAYVSSQQTNRNYVETLILSNIAPIPLLPSITVDMWYTRLCNSSVTASMCLQAPLCCYDMLDLYAGPMAVLTLSLYKSLEKENNVGLMGESGWRWADVHLVLSASSLASVHSSCKHILDSEDVLGRRSYMICTCFRVFRLRVECDQSKGKSNSSHRYRTIAGCGATNIPLNWDLTLFTAW